MMDYKAKYLEVRAQLIQATDLAWRLGYEQGQKEANQQQAQQQMQPQTDEFGNPVEQVVNGQESKFNTQPKQTKSPFDLDNSQTLNMDGTMGGQGGSELDQHINELEGLVQKGEKPSYIAIRNVVSKISDLRKNQKNMVERAEQSVTWQKKIVDDLMKSMDKKTETTLEGLEKIIAAEVKEGE